MLSAIKFTNWLNVLSKLSRFKGKLFEIRLPNFLSRSSEKVSGQKFVFFISAERSSEKASGQKLFLFLQKGTNNFLPSSLILVILHMIA